MEITLPDEVPVMTLPHTAFFPQALMPLHIFEPRYRQMLSDTLASNRIFAVAGLDFGQATDPTKFEPPHRIASVGIIRACQKNDNGTSNLLLQGLCRIEITKIICDEPYRRIRIRALASEAGASAEDNQALRRELTRLLGVKLRLVRSGPAEIMAFLRTVEDPEAFADIAAFNLCDDADFKQELLEIREVHHRMARFAAHIRTQIETIKLRQKLQGPLADERVGEN
jgi:Lon protease-like protein